MPVQPIPEGFRALTPFLVVKDVQASVDFLTRAFDAQNMGISNGPDGAPMHASVSFGDCMLMIGRSMEGNAPSMSMFFFYCKDADSAFQKAINAGGKQVVPVADQPWGDRAGAFNDADGNTWWVGTHKEDLSEEEIVERMKQAFGGQQGGASQ